MDSDENRLALMSDEMMCENLLKRKTLLLKVKPRQVLNLQYHYLNCY